MIPIDKFIVRHTNVELHFSLVLCHDDGLVGIGEQSVGVIGELQGYALVKIVCPLDDSEQSRIAIRLAYSLRRERKC